MGKRLHHRGTGTEKYKITLNSIKILCASVSLFGERSLKLAKSFLAPRIHPQKIDEEPILEAILIQSQRAEISSWKFYSGGRSLI
jgi:hypothetical protein